MDCLVITHRRDSWRHFASVQVQSCGVQVWIGPLGSNLRSSSVQQSPSAPTMSRLRSGSFFLHSCNFCLLTFKAVMRVPVVLRTLRMTSWSASRTFDISPWDPDSSSVTFTHVSCCSNRQQPNRIQFHPEEPHTTISRGPEPDLLVIGTNVKIIVPDLRKKLGVWRCSPWHSTAHNHHLESESVIHPRSNTPLPCDSLTVIFSTNGPATVRRDSMTMTTRCKLFVMRLEPCEDMSTVKVVAGPSAQVLTHSAAECAAECAAVHHCAHTADHSTSLERESPVAADRVRQTFKGMVGFQRPSRTSIE